jgi:RNA polymerase sigma factor (sigma-70 family)
MEFVMKKNLETYKDYRVNIKVRNNRILKAIEEVGGTHGEKWCKENGITYSTLNGLTNMTVSPVNNFGELTRTAKKLCEVLKKMPDELWSDEQIRPLEKNFSSFEMSSHELVSLMSSGETSYLTDFEEKIDKERLIIQIESCLGMLSENCKRVLKDRFYENKTFRQISQEMDISQERVRDLEQTALRKLRRPKMRKNLNDFIDNPIDENEWIFL